MYWHTCWSEVFFEKFMQAFRNDIGYWGYRMLKYVKDALHMSHQSTNRAMFCEPTSATYLWIFSIKAQKSKPGYRVTFNWGRCVSDYFQRLSTPDESFPNTGPNFLTSEPKYQAPKPPTSFWRSPSLHRSEHRRRENVTNKVISGSAGRTTVSRLRECGFDSSRNLFH